MYVEIEPARKLKAQREQVLYLLKELGFDTTVLQGTEAAKQLAYDDPVVVHALKVQLAKPLVDNRPRCAYCRAILADSKAYCCPSCEDAIIAATKSEPLHNDDDDMPF